MTDRIGRLVGSRNLVYGVAIFGCLLRLFHYLRNPSMWHDEAALVVNVLTKDFSGLLGTLDWEEAAPPLFLWIERAVVLTIGDSTYSLRLFPLLVSCASLLIFAGSVRQLLGRWGAFWAVFLFAASDRLSWHASEAKPYAVDVFIACCALAVAVQLRQWPLTRRLVLLAVTAPTAILLSYPACFVCGALLVYLLPEIWRSGRWRHRLLYALWSGAVLGSFALLYLGPVRAQHRGGLEGCWNNHFPDWSRPWDVPFWSLAGASDVMRYCFKPLGQFLSLFGIAGIVWLYRSGGRKWLVLLLGPLGLAWLAACLRGYPFGGSRLEVFALPGLAILIGAGVEPVRQWCRARWHWGSIGVVVLLLTPLGESLRFVAAPWPRAEVDSAADFILARRQSGEAIAANHWEYAYYFRRQRDDFQWLGGDPRRHGSRVWIAFTSFDDKERHELGESYARHGHVVICKEFTFTSVFLLDLTAPPDSTAQAVVAAAR